MQFRRPLTILSLAIATALPLALPSTVLAQAPMSASSATIAAFGVEQVQRLRPGEVLAFRLTGTPGASVTLQIAGATAGVRMNEVQPGQYEGDYTIRQRDRLTASSLVTARIEKNGNASSATLARALVVGARDPVLPASSQISAFNVTAPERIRAGDELGFSLTGTPGGKARVVVQGLAKPIPLTEVSRGVYEGSYVMRRNERLRGDLVASGYLVSDKRETSQRFTRAQASGDGDVSRNDNRNNDRNDYRNDNRPTPVAACAACGSVVSVQTVEVKKDEPNVLGTIAGGVLGGVLGHQVGGGSGKDLATVVGAVGGAYAGNRVENNMGKRQVYRVTVRLEGGSSQSFDYADDPAIKVGTRVKVDGGKLIRL